MSRPAYLADLLETGSIAHSSVPKPVLRELKALDLVAVESHKFRRRVLVTNRNAFADWLAARYPSASPELSTLPSRAQNVARARSSKAGDTTHEVQPVLLKWFSNQDLEAARLTARYGLLAVTSNRVVDLPWPTAWRLLLVENWESFYTLDYPPVEAPLVAVYLGGHVAAVTLEALSSISPPPSRSLCFVDYDWTGLQIYARVRHYLPTIGLYLPPDLESLFARYARHELATEQPPFFDDDPACEYVISLVQQYNAGLEQEIVLPPPCDFQ